jgi:3-hydroxy-D-aspartate aldolase
MRHGTTIGCLVEIDCGAGRCGVAPGAEAVPIAQAIADAPGLSFEGLQAYQGAMQHFESHAERALAAGDVMRAVSATLEALGSAGLPCPIVGGGGTGSFEFEGNSGLFTELQCGSYAFMDAAYGRLTDATGAPVSQFENALFLLTSVMSHAKPDQAVCDAGLKVQSVDSGLPTVFGRDDVAYVKCSDEHGVIADPHGRLAIGDRLKLVPGHCDPTCNLHDHYIGVRGGVVETVWPVSARGKHF